MEISVLRQELEALPPEQQDRLSAFLTALRMKREGIISEFTRRLDDRSDQNWRPWNEVKNELELNSTEED